MVGIVIVTHGKMAEGILNSMQMISGSQNQLAIVELEESYSTEYLTELVEAAIDEVDSGSGAIIMVDLYGATPYNVSAGLYLKSDHHIEIITGVNLPMLLETAIQRKDLDLKSVFDIAHQAGTSGIRSLPDHLRKYQN